MERNVWDLTEKYVKELEHKKKGKKKKKKKEKEGESDEDESSDSDSSSSSSEDEKKNTKNKQQQQPEKEETDNNEDYDPDHNAESAETPWTAKKFNGPLPNFKQVDQDDIAYMLASYDYFTMALVGRRRSGKSYLAEYLLQFLTKKYSFAIVMTDTKINEYWQAHFPENYIIEGYRSEVLEQLIERQKKLVKLKRKHPELQINCACLLVLEDFISNTKVRFDKSLEKMYTLGRHLEIDVVALSQDAKGLPPIMRGNTDITIIMKMFDLREKEAIWEDYINEVDKEVWYAINDHILIGNDIVNEEPPLSLLINDLDRAAYVDVEEKWKLITAGPIDLYVIGSRDYWAEAGELGRYIKAKDSERQKKAEELIHYDKESEWPIDMKLNNEFDSKKELSSHVVPGGWTVVSKNPKSKKKDGQVIDLNNNASDEPELADPFEVEEHLRQANRESERNRPKRPGAANANSLLPHGLDDVIARPAVDAVRPVPLLPIPPPVTRPRRTGPTPVARGPQGRRLPAWMIRNASRNNRVATRGRRT